MRSQLQEEDVGHVARSSVQYHAPKLSDEKVSSAEENRGIKPQGNTCARSSATPLGNRHKRWPGRRANEAEEVVKYMSSVPNYLKQLETGEVVQARALNCGVLDWGHLERWTYLQKHVANRRGEGSPSSSNASSSPFSTFGSSSQSDRSGDSPPTTRNKFLNPKMHQNSSAKGQWTKMHEQHSEQVVNPDLRTSLTNASIGRNCERAKVNILDMKPIFSEGSTHARRLSYDSATNNRRLTKVEDGIFPGVFACKRSSTTQIDKTSAASNSLTKNEVLNTNAKCKYEKKISDDVPEKCTMSASQKVNVAPRRDLSPQRLLRAGLNRIKSASFREGSSVQHRSDNSHDGTSASSSKGRRSSSPQRILNAGLNLLRNSSLREASPGRQRKDTVSSDNPQEDHADPSTKSRRSPLRRLFDPLKLKNQIHFSGPVTSLPSHRALGASNTNELLIRDQLKAANAPGKSSDTINSPFSGEVTDARCSVESEKQPPATRQALLKIGWKGGLPVFVFSSSDINILTATVEKKTIPQNNDFKCTYTIYTAHELKKKSGVWTSQINKGGKHDLASNVVGQMRVSSPSSEPKNNISVREFVLFGAEEVSHTHELVGPHCKPELAAIVINVQNERLDNHNCKELESSDCSDSSVGNSKTEHKYESLSLASVVAVIPSGVHGVSSSGTPSPLIERWKSGGSCDCGGWDEGCMLSILTDKIEESSAEKSYQIELFAQGGAKGNKHAFSMVTFQEGIYRVDFGTSISTIQAFAMCIAILHSRKQPTLPWLHCSADSESSDKQVFSCDTNNRVVDTKGGARKSYVLEHPPVSPVRRA